MTASATTDAYAIRPYEPADRDAVLELYDDLLDERPGAWFDWKFCENPYADEVPIVVTEHDGEVVGARPHFPFEVGVGGEVETAVCMVGAMVHADHRRQGLFSRMVEKVYDRYAAREPVTSIGFPNEQAEAALLGLSEALSLDHAVVEPFPTYYRVQDPAAFADESLAEPYRSLARLGRPAATAYLRARDALAPDSSFVGVRRHDSVPVERLADLATRNAPDAVHARRDERFYRWRVAYPKADYEAYTAHVGGRLVAAALVGSRPTAVGDRDAKVVRISDVLPLSAGEDGSEGRSDRSAALAALFGRVVADHRDAALLSVAGRAVPERVLDAYGFHADTDVPLARVTTTDSLLARPLTHDDLDSWVVNGCDLSDPESWQLSFCEYEIS